MNKPDGAPDEVEVSDDVTEARIRRSLGLSATPTPQAGHGHAGGSSYGGGNGSSHGGGNGSSSGSMQRRRFVRDGEVPTVIVHPKSETEARHAAALADLARQRDAERAGRLRAEQALQEAQATIQSLQTRIVHADMARTEAAAAVLPASPESVTTVDEPDAKAAHPTLSSPPPSPVAGASKPRRAKAASAPDHEEPTPVKWWR